MKTGTKVLLGLGVAAAGTGVLYYRAAKDITFQIWDFGISSGGLVPVTVQVNNPNRFFSYPIPAMDLGVFDANDNYLGTVHNPILQVIPPGVSYIHAVLQPNLTALGQMVLIALGQSSASYTMQGVVKLGPFVIPVNQTIGVSEG